MECSIRAIGEEFPVQRRNSVTVREFGRPGVTHSSVYGGAGHQNGMATAETKPLKKEAKKASAKKEDG
jgi:hypothetical protein